MSRLTAALIALALTTFSACKPEERPAPVRQAAVPLDIVPLPTIAVTDTGHIPDRRLSVAARAACDTIARLFREVAKADKATSSTFTAPRDTTSTYLDRSGAVPPLAEPACLVAWKDTVSRDAPLELVHNRLEQTGWTQRGNLFTADGPDSGSLAFSRGSAACIIEGLWDGDDDSDSTYVPKPGFRISATCLRDRPDPSS
ncbi:MAG: hypothetical protein ACJ796_09710 [Gemmatimonadaceae bacterium]